MLKLTFDKVKFRHALSPAIAVLIALFIQHLFFSQQSSWIVLTSFLVCQTTQGTPIRQNLYIFLSIAGMLVLAVGLQQLIHHEGMVFVILGLLFLFFNILLCYYRPFTLQNFNLLFFPFLVLLLALLDVNLLNYSLMNLLLDSVIGASIGIIVNFIIKIPITNEFKQGVVPLLIELREYTVSLQHSLTQQETDKGLNKTKQRLEKTLLSEISDYPAWAFEVGFNRGLRSGFRFFLLNLEHISDMLLAMDYVTEQLQADAVQDLLPELTITLEKNAELLTVLQNYFQYNQLQAITADFTSDVKALENALRKLLPGHLELLDLSPNYMALISIVKNLKDIRGLLLQLVMALPTADIKIN